MTRGQKRATALLALTFTAGALGGALTTVSIVKAHDRTIWMPQACYTIVREAEVEAIVEETAVEETEVVNLPEEAPALNEIHLGDFKLTAYCTCSKCCGQWADGITATGTKATPGRTVAVDPDVIPLGSKVFINGFEYTAEDTGGAIKGHRIDILFPSHQEALNFGVQYGEVSIIKN